MAKLDLASSEWCQLIFEGKNQAYGAYRMRANSPRRHTIAMLIVVAIAIVGFTIPTLLKLATPVLQPVSPLASGQQYRLRWLRHYLLRRQWRLPLW